MVQDKLWNRNYIAVCAANFLLFFSFYILLPMLPMYLHDTFNADRSMSGMILSGYTISALLIRPFGGFFVDSFPRKVVLLTCYFLFFIFFAGYILAGTLLMFAVVRTLHGFPFGAVTVANSTVAIDVMPASRRNEGIGYYGVSNNLAMAIGPSLSMFIYESGASPHLIFAISMAAALTGFILDSTIKVPRRELVKDKQPISLDRFFLTRGISESMIVLMFSFAYGILSTYVAIYGRDEIGLKGGSGQFFVLLATGLVVARLTTAQWVKRGRLTDCVSTGMILTIIGFSVFVFVRSTVGFYASALILGGGYGSMCPSFQTMFIDMAPNSRRGTANSTYLTSWDTGVGLGVLIGGHIAEVFSYHTAYMTAIGVCVVGALVFYRWVCAHFNSHKLR